MATENIIIIGGGISGITSALTLQLLGFDTQIYTRQRFDLQNKNKSPEFASLFPSASVIPHSVYHDQLESIFKNSQSVFYELRKRTFPGLTIHKHFEIFEFEPDQPEHIGWMMNGQSIDDIDSRSIPRKNTKRQLWGWVFDCIFADWPIYFPALISLYKECGGKILTKKLQHNDIAGLPASIIINCSGAGSPFLFDDPAERQLFLRGHLIQKLQAPLITNTANEIISYNYTPDASIYSDPEGNPCDVYCYPRKDGWYIGGSRQAGRLDENKNWKGLEWKYDSYKIDGISIPRPVVDLNNEILEQTFGLGLKLSDSLQSMLGYRYVRTYKNGLRLEEDTVSGRKIIHNYGHGGAGVALSWGCALKIAEILKSSTDLIAHLTEIFDSNASFRKIIKDRNT